MEKQELYQKAITEAQKSNLTNNHFYFTLPGELYTGDDSNKAKTNFEKTLLLAKSK